MVTISMMALWNTNAIIEYDRRRSGLSSAPLDMEQDNNSIEQYPLLINAHIHIP